ncbi:hypothetical protein ATH50_3440 [Haloplanus aerogenes]|nr:hypothetical protein ATH50_3440 [Haloplanus aerogenes]
MSELKPLAAASGMASGVWAVFEFGLLNLDSLLGVFVPLAYRIAPRVSWLPQDALNYTVFLLSVVFVAFALARLAGRAYERIT